MVKKKKKESGDYKPPVDQRFRPTKFIKTDGSFMKYFTDAELCGF